MRSKPYLSVAPGMNASVTARNHYNTMVNQQYSNRYATTCIRYLNLNLHKQIANAFVSPGAVDIT